MCQHDSKFCTSCEKEDLVYDEEEEILLNRNKCTTVNKKIECDDGSYYDSIEKKCNFCDINCSKCYGKEEDKCLNCNDIRKPNLLNGFCVKECGEGYFLDSFTKNCFKCNSKCKKCEEKSNKCSSCKNGYKLNEKNQCVENFDYGKSSFFCDKKTFNKNNPKYLSLYFKTESCSDKKCYKCSQDEPSYCFLCKSK
jgi:hypothetical protein